LYHVSLKIELILQNKKRLGHYQILWYDNYHPTQNIANTK